MQGISETTIIGTLAKDPEQNGPAVRLTIPTSEKWKDKQTGEMKEKTEWHRVILFGKNAENAAKYLSKGSNVYIKGKNETQKYTDQNGHERYATQVICNIIQFLPGGPQKQQQTEQAQQADISDEIPF